MIYLLLSFFIFISAVILHIILQKTILIFSLGFLINSTLLMTLPSLTWSNNMSWWTFALPLSASGLYLILSSLYLIYYANISYDEGSPSAAIYSRVRKLGKINYSAILKHFSNQDLIVKRLNNLSQIGFIEKRGNNYFILPKGKLVVIFFNLYRKILNWDEGG